MHKSITILLCIAFIFLEHQFCKAQYHIDDWGALKALYESTNGDSWINNTNSNKIIYASNTTDYTLNNMFGLQVNPSGRVSSIDLSKNQLSGYITPEIEKLSYLKELNLLENKISDQLPSSRDDLQLLNISRLENNKLNRSISLQKGNLKLIRDMNPIEFQITNAFQTDPIITQGNKTILPIEFDLNIDSLGFDVTAHQLCLSLHLPSDYQDITLKKIYEPLTVDELTVTKTNGEINICINRLNEEAAKKSGNFPLVASRSSILQFGVCIVSEILKRAPSTIEPIVISGYTNTGFDEAISFKPSTLPFGFDYENIATDPKNMLEISLMLNYKNCKTLGAIAIEVLNKNVVGVPPYTYTLCNATNNILDEIEITNTTHQFYGLEEGTYRLKIEDSTNKWVTKKFRINFISEPNGSICCPENLTIPPGSVSGMFNATNTIGFSKGTLISEGVFEICE